MVNPYRPNIDSGRAEDGSSTLSSPRATKNTLQPVHWTPIKQKRQPIQSQSSSDDSSSSVSPTSVSSDLTGSDQERTSMARLVSMLESSTSSFAEASLPCGVSTATPTTASTSTTPSSSLPTVEKKKRRVKVSAQDLVRLGLLTVAKEGGDDVEVVMDKEDIVAALRLLQGHDANKELEARRTRPSAGRARSRSRARQRPEDSPRRSPRTAPKDAPEERSRRVTRTVSDEEPVKPRRASRTVTDEEPLSSRRVSRTVSEAEPRQSTRRGRSRGPSESSSKRSESRSRSLTRRESIEQREARLRQDRQRARSRSRRPSEERRRPSALNGIESAVSTAVSLMSDSATSLELTSKPAASFESPRRTRATLGSSLSDLAVRAASLSRDWDPPSLAPSETSSSRKPVAPPVDWDDLDQHSTFSCLEENDTVIKERSFSCLEDILRPPQPKPSRLTESFSSVERKKPPPEVCDALRKIAGLTEEQIIALNSSGLIIKEV